MAGFWGRWVFFWGVLSRRFYWDKKMDGTYGYGMGCGQRDSSGSSREDGWDEGQRGNCCRKGVRSAVQALISPERASCRRRRVKRR